MHFISFEARQHAAQRVFFRHVAMGWGISAACYAVTVEVRTQFERPAPSMRLSTATATAASVRWPRQSRARGLGPMIAL